MWSPKTTSLNYIFFAARSPPDGHFTRDADKSSALPVIMSHRGYLRRSTGQISNPTSNLTRHNATASVLRSPEELNNRLQRLSQNPLTWHNA